LPLKALESPTLQILFFCTRHQSHELGASEYRGDAGCLRVSRGRSQNPLHKAFIEAGRQAGYPSTDDFNGAQQEGFGTYDLSISRGKRSRLELLWNARVYTAL
jgi:choline dehydrogenase